MPSWHGKCTLGGVGSGGGLREAHYREGGVEAHRERHEGGPGGRVEVVVRRDVGHEVARGFATRLC